MARSVGKSVQALEASGDILARLRCTAGWCARDMSVANPDPSVPCGIEGRVKCELIPDTPSGRLSGNLSPSAARASSSDTVSVRREERPGAGAHLGTCYLASAVLLVGLPGTMSVRLPSHQRSMRDRSQC